VKEILKDAKELKASSSTSSTLLVRNFRILQSSGLSNYASKLLAKLSDSNNNNNDKYKPIAAIALYVSFILSKVLLRSRSDRTMFVWRSSAA